MNAHNRPSGSVSIPFAQIEALPARERVLDRLADLMFAADEVLDMLHAEDAMRIQWVVPHVQKAYDEVNEVMKRLCD